MTDNTTFYATLDNGIKIVFRPNLSSIVYCGMAIGTGTRDEQQPGIYGMAHFIEHTLFKGTQKRTARQIINRIEDVGGEINAYTTKEETFFYAAVMPQYFERAAELIADMIYHPTFPEREVKKEIEVIYDEIESYNDSPSELIYDDFEALIFQGHSLEHPILGTRRTLRYMNGKKATDFMLRHYNTDSMVFFVQGNLKPRQVMRFAEKYLSSSPYSRRMFQRLPPLDYQPRKALYRKHTHQAHVLIGNRAYPIAHDKQVALFLLNNILGGGGMKSLLNLSLREQRGLVYTVESSYTPLSDSGYWSVYFACEPDNVQLCIDLIILQLNQLMSKMITGTALRKYKKQLLGQLAINNENQENSALAMAKYMLYFGYAPTLDQIAQQIEQITPQDLNNVAKEIFNPAQLSVLKYN